MEELLQTIIKDNELARRIVIGGFWYSGGSLLFVLGVLIKFWASNITSRITTTETKLGEFDTACRKRHEWNGKNRRQE